MQIAAHKADRQSQQASCRQKYRREVPAATTSDAEGMGRSLYPRLFSPEVVKGVVNAAIDSLQENVGLQLLTRGIQAGYPECQGLVIIHRLAIGS
jgi:hypothetical protein